MLADHGGYRSSSRKVKIFFGVSEPSQQAVAGYCHLP